MLAKKYSLVSLEVEGIVDNFNLLNQKKRKCLKRLNWFITAFYSSLYIAFSVLTLWRGLHIKLGNWTFAVFELVTIAFMTGVLISFIASIRRLNLALAKT